MIRILWAVLSMGLLLGIAGCDSHRKTETPKARARENVGATDIDVIHAPKGRRGDNSRTHERDAAKMFHRRGISKTASEAASTGTAIINGILLMYPDDAAVAGAKITARHEESASSGVVGEAVSGRDGSFHLEGMPGGSVDLFVKDVEGRNLWPAPGENADALSITVADKQTTDVSLRVFPGYHVSGVVFDKDTSEPLEAATAELLSDIDDTRETTTSAEGRYEFDRVRPDGDPFVSAKANGYMLASNQQTYYIKNTPGLLLSPSANSASIVKNVAMSAVILVGGRIENHEGYPVVGASIKWKGTISDMGGDQSFATSDVRGIFQFEALPFQNVLIEVTADGYAFKRTEEIKLSTANVLDLVIVLDQGATAEGTVINPDGDPVENAEIKTRDFFSLGGAFHLFDKRSVASTDAAGHFRITSLPTGKTALEASADEYAPASETVDLKAGEKKTDVEIRLGEELTIEGRVVDGDDKPVQAYMNRENYPAIKTDSEGRFTLRGLSSGNISFYVTALNSQRLKEITAKAGDKNVVVRFEDEEPLKGKVVDGETEKPIKKFSVSGKVYNTDGVDAGVFRLFLQPGYSTYPVISAEGYVSKSFEVTAPKDGSKDTQIFKMGRGSGVSGRVVSATTGDPLPDIPVTVSENASFKKSEVGNSVSDKNGKFLIAKIPSGKVTVTARPALPMAPNDVTVELKEGEFKDVGDIVVGGSATIVGTVVKDPSGEPYPGQYVNLNWTRSSGKVDNTVQVSDDEGRVKFKNLSQGEHTLIVVGSWKQTVKLKPSEVRKITIRLGATMLHGSVTKAGQLVGAGIVAVNAESGEKYSGRQSAQIEGDDYSLGNGMTHHTQTASDGYTLRNVAPGTYNMTVTVQANDVTSGGVHSETYTVPDEPRVEKDFALP